MMNSNHVRSSLADLDFICISTCLCMCFSGLLFQCICILKNGLYSESAQSLACGARDGRLVFAVLCPGTKQGTISEETCWVLPYFLRRLWVKDTHLLQGSEFSHLILQCDRGCYITLPCDQFQSQGKYTPFNSPVHLEPSETCPLNLALIILKGK